MRKSIWIKLIKQKIKERRQKRLGEEMIDETKSRATKEDRKRRNTKIILKNNGMN